MKRPLLLLASLVLTASYAGYAQAQYNLIGQTAGTAYVNFAPPIILTGQSISNTPAGGGTSQAYTLDFDQDGYADLDVSASDYTVVGRYPSHETYILARHTNIEFYTVGFVPMGLAIGDTMQSNMHRRNATSQLGAWLNGYSTYNGTISYNRRTLSLVGSGGNGNLFSGEWLDKQEHYVGFRLRTNAAAPWHYGWLLTQATSTSYPATLVIKSYALASQPLGVRSALAAGWQLYPTQVADQLTVEPPAEAGKGQLTIVDLCGRQVVSEKLTGHQQQVRLPALAAGVYVVHMDTPAGSFVQRIIKQ